MVNRWAALLLGGSDAVRASWIVAVEAAEDDTAAVWLVGGGVVVFSGES